MADPPQKESLKSADSYSEHLTTARGCMARLVRKVFRLTSVRHCGVAGKCLLLFIVICVIKVIVLFLVRHSWLDPAYFSSHIGMEAFLGQTGLDVTTEEELWRPPHSKIARVLKELNLNEGEAQRHLPLTLDSRLWLNNASLCTDDSGTLVPLDILFVVHAVPDRFHRRLLMRSTIAFGSHFRPFKHACVCVCFEWIQIRVVFVVGRVDDPILQQALETEHGVYGDTVQGDFPDTDSNLPHKGVLGLRWAWQYCPHARHVVKLDDSVFFDPFKMLLRHRALFEGRPRSLFCHVLPKNTMRIYREHDHPWAVEKDQFQGLSTFPYDYCSGLVVVITSDLILALFRAAFYTPVFWIEDVYLFGILPAILGDVAMIHLGHHQRRFIDLNTTRALGCMRQRKESCPVLATTSQTTEEWETLWNLTYTLHHDLGWDVPFVLLPP